MGWILNWSILPVKRRRGECRGTRGIIHSYNLPNLRPGAQPMLSSTMIGTRLLGGEEVTMLYDRVT